MHRIFEAMKSIASFSILAILLMTACGNAESDMVKQLCSCMNMEDEAEQMTCLEELDEAFPPAAIAEMNPEKLAEALKNSSCSQSDTTFGEMTDEKALKAAEAIIEANRNK